MGFVLLVTAASAADLARYNIVPSPLLEVDQRRQSIIDGIVVQWGDVLLSRYGSSAKAYEQSLRSALYGLRADALLAVSVTNSFGPIEALLQTSPTSRAAAPRVTTKAIGDATADLSYTPIVPCRIVDTRYGGGGTLPAGDTRNWLASNPSGSFATQGGAGTNCGISQKPAAVLFNVVVANTGPGPAFATAWPYAVARPVAATLNWTMSGEQIANAVAVPLCSGICSGADFSLYVSSSADVIIDVLGYFAPPAGGFVTNTPVNGGPTYLDVTNVLGGSKVNAITNGAVGATIVGGGCSAGNGCSTGGANTVNDNFGTVVGGYGNLAGYGAAGTVGGGVYNEAAGGFSTVAGGNSNAALWQNASVGGGSHNQAQGPNSTVPGGADNIASGFGSFAAGTGAKTYSAGNPAASHDGTFAWADFVGFPPLPFNTIANAEFAARARGGVRFVTAIDGNGVPTWTCGVSGGAGGSWGCSSDRRVKSGFVPFDGIDALDRLSALPVYHWYATDDPRKTPHAGPTAQDFMRVFGLGDNDTMIGFADAQGVAFAAIQGLQQRLRERDDVIAAQGRQLEELARRLETLERR
jgi:hypothetical protein